MKILVTGATGFIGHTVCRRLLLNHHDVVAVSRSEKRAREVLQFPFECIEHDLLQGPLPAKYSSALSGLDAVIHLAGEPIAASRWSAAQKKAIGDSRVLGTRNLVASVKPRVFVSTSAVGYYGDRGDQLLSETAERGEGFLSEVCRDWESEVGKAQTERTVIFRLGMVIAHGEGALKKMEPAFSRGLGGVLGDGQQWVSWIHVEDVVSAILKALEDPAMRGVYNAVSPGVVRNAEFTKVLAKSFEKCAPFRIPAFALKLVLGEMSTVLLNSQRAVPERLLAQGFRFQFEALEKALSG